jgi:hypothetical protein
MDVHSPDHLPARPKQPPSAALVRRLLNALVAAIPPSMRDDAATPEEDRAIALELFEAYEPHDAAEAQRAVLSIATGFSSLDSLTRAAQPGVSAETATRLRASGLAAERACRSAHRALTKPAEKPPAPKRVPARQLPEPEPAVPPAAVPTQVPTGHIALQVGAAPIPATDGFQPRDRRGQPIPPHRVDLMTRAQVLAALACPRDPALEAAALAEEEAMIAQEEAGNREIAPAE